jgi:phosphoserine aminotransferase
MKKHNFSAGPSILPQPVFKEAADAVRDFNGIGLSILEISHRSPDFDGVMNEAVALVQELLELPPDYKVLFLSGGASTQFFALANNLLDENDRAAYIDTGTWSSKSIKEAVHFGQVDIVASSKEDNYNYIPKQYSIPSDAKYLHITSNNTIFGTQYQEWPEVEVPLVCDMSSDIFSRRLPIDKFGMIYAGAQKNMGPAGTTLVIIKEDLLGHVKRHIPTMVDYRTHIKKGSMFNTPPVFPIYVSMLVMRWLKQNGGIDWISSHNKKKAAIIYEAIDQSPIFKGTAKLADRSLMNIPFVPTDPDLQAPFLDLCNKNGIIGIKGHRSVGGFRASTYNALAMESAEFLADLITNFSREHA